MQVAGRTVRPSPRPAPRPSRWPAALVVTLAVVVAVVPSWHVSLWYDETATISGAGRSLADLRRLTAETNAAQGLYYLLVHAWSALFGSSAVALRALSAAAVGMATAGVVSLARRGGDDRTAVLAGTVFALLPRVTWAGIEGRPYALTAAVAVWLTVLAVLAVDGRERSRRARVTAWVGYGVLAGLGIALFVYLGLLVLVHGLVLVVYHRRQRAVVGAWVGATLLGGLIASPVVLVSSGQTSQLGIADRLGPVTLLRSLFVTEWFLGDTPTPVAAALRPASPSVTTMTWTVAAVVLAVVGWSLAVAGLRTAPTANAPDDPGAVRPVDLRPWLVGWLVVPAAVIGGYSVVVAPMYVPRYLTFAAPALAVLVARGAVTLARRTRPGAVAVLALCVVCAAPVIASQRTAFAKNGTDWSAVAAYVGAHRAAGDGVYYAPRGAVPAGDPVTTTMRAVATGYPDDFRGLVDVTAETSPAAAASLWGTSYRLAEVRDRLTDLDVVWVVRRRDQDLAAVAADDAVLTAAGFTGRTAWTGPSSVVARFSRS